MNIKICVKLFMYFSFYLFFSANSIYAAGPSEKLYDIKFSFDLLQSDKVNPFYKSYWQDIQKLIVLDKQKLI